MRRFHWMILTVVLLAAALCGPLAALAQEPVSVVDEFVGRVGQVMGEVERARQVLGGVMRTGTPEEIAKAQEQVKTAEEKLAATESKLETAREDALAKEAGVSAAKVREMRASGMGWGVIAKELGVHPSALGLARGKGAAKGKNKVKKNKQAKVQGDDGSAADDDEDDGSGKGGSKNKNKGKGKKK